MRQTWKDETNRLAEKQTDKLTEQKKAGGQADRPSERQITIQKDTQTRKIQTNRQKDKK